ncbi:GPI-anchored cell wall beta-1,3-endoglucanase EglC [Phyllosticta citricarpa]
MHISKLVALAASVSTAAAQIKGFNYGATFSDKSVKQQADFENEFKTAQGLVGASGFASARLYTMIQGGTTNTPISAIQAAINTKTSLLLGLWISAGPDSVNNEVAALKAAIAQYGTAFTDLIIGISVGSEDMYRETPEGIASNAGPGVQPQQIVSYIQQVRDAIKGTTAASAPIGHVDTWTTFANSSNSAVIAACDWLGMDAYPYFQSAMDNTIDNSKSIFYDALGEVQKAASGKPVWVTETGWPVSGATLNKAEANVENAKKYWDEVGCSLFGSTNTWWYTLQDAAPASIPLPFGIVGSTLSTTPLFDLTCGSSVSNSSSSHSAASSSSFSAAPMSTPASPAAASASVADHASQAASGASAGGASALPSNPVGGNAAAPSAPGATALSGVGGLAAAPSVGTRTNVGSDGVTTLLVVTMETVSACHA